MKRKLIFLDVDGTLCNEDGLVPSSAAEAVKRARANGHLVYLCTGRSKAEIFDFIWEIGFDGVIGAGGGYVQIGDQMLYHKHVSEQNVRHMVDFFVEHNVDFYLESNGGLYASPNLIGRLERILYGDIDNDPEARKRKEENPHFFIQSLIVGADLYLDDINKACFLESLDVSFETIKKEFESEFEVIHCTVPAFGDDSGELAVPGVHKATAIETLITHLGINQQDTIAVGDGLNDLEMLKYCNTGIAMGNAVQDLKDMADDITDSHNDNGIYNTFIKYNLI